MILSDQWAYFITEQEEGRPENKTMLCERELQAYVNIANSIQNIPRLTGAGNVHNF